MGIGSVREEWAEQNRWESAEVQSLRDNGLQLADKASHQLQMLDAKLGNELRGRHVTNTALQSEVRASEQQFAAFLSEESTLRQAWCQARDRLVKEAAAVTSDLRRMSD